MPNSWETFLSFGFGGLSVLPRIPASSLYSVRRFFLASEERPEKAAGTREPCWDLHLLLDSLGDRHTNFRSEISSFALEAIRYPNIQKKGSSWQAVLGFQRMDFMFIS